MSDSSDDRVGRDLDDLMSAARPQVPERAGREGDSQGLPVRNANPYVQDLVIRDIEARKQLGIRRYGTALQAHNGRDALLDAYEEAIDLAIYLKQAMIERDTHGSST